MSWLIDKVWDRLMIRYKLICNKSHEFEGWFRSSDDYQRQTKRGLVDCPECGSRHVRKALMAPSVARRDKGRPTAAREDTGQATGAQQPVTVANAVSAEHQDFAARRREILAMMRKLRSEVLANSENVGDRFPEEARKMHYREVEPRAVHGEATLSEVKELLEEGVDIYPVPQVPDEHN
jgi:hypothetical protein